MPHNKISYWKRKKKGLCVDCCKNAATGLVRCREHILLKKIKDKRLFNKRKENNSCVGCGIKLHLEIDKSHVKCMNCREHLPKGVHIATNKS